MFHFLGSDRRGATGEILVAIVAVGRRATPAGSYDKFRRAFSRLFPEVIKRAVGRGRDTLSLYLSLLKRQQEIPLMMLTAREDLKAIIVADIPLYPSLTISLALSFLARATLRKVH